MLDMPRRALRKIGQRLQMARVAASADAFLASYPKSGRTWLRFILSHYLAALAAPGSEVDLFSMFAVVPNFALDRERGMPAFRYGAYRPKLPLVLVTHHRFRRWLFLRRPVIFMVRDPRDVIVSAYFHATRHKHRFEGGMDSFIGDAAQGLPALIAYHNGWGTGLQGRSSAVLSYEELTADTANTTARILSFLGCTPDEPTLTRAVAAARFEAMRELELRSGLPAHDYDRSDSESLRMRRGRIGGFQDYLTVAQQERVLASCRAGLTPAAKGLVARTGMPLGGGQKKVSDLSSERQHSPGSARLV